MKRKHYPFLTVVVATLLTVVPLLLLSLSMLGSSTDSDIALDELRDDNLHSSVAVEPKASKESVAAITESNVIAVSEDRSSKPVAPIIAQQLESPTQQQSGQLPSFLRKVLAAIPSGSAPRNDVSDSADSVASELPEIPPTSEFTTPDFPQPAPVIAENQVVELPIRPDTGASYYEATGHLALRTQAQVPDPLANQAGLPASSKERHAVADAGDVASEKNRKSKSRKSKSEEKTSADVVSDSANSDPALPVDPPRAGTRSADDHVGLIEDVVIQTPVESALVSRVENVVAMTRARGWPIALIRSDLPDDVWWVQQVVGIQGASFAARVNFGNEYTLSGSGFSMVIVFLDSPDEVRRFRIAKQFKEIPEGVRRSREFHYIRN